MRTELNLLRVLAVFILILSATRFAFGATYYVAQTAAGDDDGSSCANADAVSELNAGSGVYADLQSDTVYFCDTITTAIVMPVSGTSGNVITLRGDDPTNPGTLDANESNASCIDLNNQDYITIDGITMIDGTSFGIDSYGSASTNITVQNCTFSGHDTAAISLTSSQINNWTIDNNIITVPAAGIGIDVISGPDYITITNNTISGGDYGIRVGNNNTTDVSSNITITGNTVDDSGDLTPSAQHPIQVYVYSDTSDTYVISNNTVTNPAANVDCMELAWNGNPTSITVTNNTVTNDTPTTGDYGIVVDMLGSGTATITGNSVSDVPSGGIYILGGTGHDVARNYIYNCGGSASADFPGIHIKSKNWDSAQDAPDAVASSHVVSYNLVVNCSRGIGAAVEDGLTANSIKFYNNTIYGTDASGTGTNLGSIYAYDTDGTMSGFTVKNNIIYDGGADYFLYVSADCATSMDFDDNIWYGTPSTYKWVVGATSTDTLATYNALTGVGTDIEQDPSLTSSYHLSSTSSPAYNTGTDVGLSTDYRGVAVGINGGVDIGTYEYVETLFLGTVLNGVSQQ